MGIFTTERDRQEEDYQEWLAGFEEYLDAMDLHGVCRRCSYIREIYGKYKDPDDEWRAIDELCNKCPQEVMK